MTDQEGMRNRSTSKWGDATQPASGMWGRGPIPSPWRWYCEYQHLGYDSLRYICIHFSKGSLSPGMEPLTSQILKYSKITHKFLWEFYHQQRERTLLVWKKKKNTQLQGLEFSQFFSVVIWLIEIKHMFFWKYTIKEWNQSFVFYFRIFFHNCTFSTSPYFITKNGDNETATWSIKSNPLQPLKANNIARSALTCPYTLPGRKHFNTLEETKNHIYKVHNYKVSQQSMKA